MSGSRRFKLSVNYEIPMSHLNSANEKFYASYIEMLSLPSLLHVLGCTMSYTENTELISERTQPKSSLKALNLTLESRRQQTRYKITSKKQ